MSSGRGGASRPRVVCHILQSANGKTSGPFFGLGSTSEIVTEYERLGGELGGDAVAYGSVTAGPIFGLGSYEAAKTCVREDPAPDAPGDSVSEGRAGRYVLIVDPCATLRFADAYARGHGMDGWPFVVLVAASTPCDYLDHLNENGVMHVRCGGGRFDLADGLVRLRATLGIERIVLRGGGVANASFMSAGLVDELSLLVAPSVELSAGATELFGPQGSVWPSSPREYRLLEVRRVGADGVWLHYTR